MGLLPLQHETLILPMASEEVEHNLLKNTVAPDFDKGYDDNQEFLLNGIVEEGKFKVSVRLKHANNFLPLVKGKIESTSRGSIIFVTYLLFFSTRVFLIFWTVVVLFISTLFFFSFSNILYTSIALLLGIANYLITLGNFNRQVKKSKEVVYKVFGV